jgi:hypothetical protein
VDSNMIWALGTAIKLNFNDCKEGRYKILYSTPPDIFEFGTFYFTIGYRDLLEQYQRAGMRWQDESWG